MDGNWRFSRSKATISALLLSYLLSALDRFCSFTTLSNQKRTPKRPKFVGTWQKCVCINWNWAWKTWMKIGQNVHIPITDFRLTRDRTQARQRFSAVLTIGLLALCFAKLRCAVLCVEWCDVVNVVRLRNTNVWISCFNSIKTINNIHTYLISCVCRFFHLSLSYNVCMLIGVFGVFLDLIIFQSMC